MNINRREFAALAGAGAAAAAEKKVRIGIVGGRFGATFQFHEHPDCVVEAVADLRADRRSALMKAYRCAKAYDSLEALLRDRNIDAVFLATPAPDHRRHVELTLAAGKHVLSAVPAVVGTLEDCSRLVDAVRRSGLKYMMAETSYYHPAVISARKFHAEGKFGRLITCEAEYLHPGLESLYIEDGRRTWRYGLAPMHYPTHCTAMLLGVTRERLTKVSCLGWGDDSPILAENPYRNPFWGETAMFHSSRGTPFRVQVQWRCAAGNTERAEWIGTKMSLYEPHPNGTETTIVTEQDTGGFDSGGFPVKRNKIEKFAQPVYWKTDMLPEPLRHPSGHEGSHTFLTHEFIRAIVEDRQPAVDVYEAVAYTAPGIVAHDSALRGGELLKIPSFDRS
jgi:predicted dehydrogenase